MTAEPPSPTGTRVLLWMLEATPDIDEEWNEWYSTEHVAALMHVPGFRSGARYRLREEYTDDDPPAYLAFYDLDGPHVLRSDSYLTNRASLGEGQRPAWTRRMMAAVTKARGGVYVPAEHERHPAPPPPAPDALLAVGVTDEAAEWVDAGLLPAMREAPGLVGVRDLALEAGSPPAAHMRERSEAPGRLLLFGFEDEERAGAAGAALAARADGVTLAIRYTRILTAMPAA